MKTFKGTVEDLNEFVVDLKCEISKDDLYTTENEKKPFHDGYFFKILSESGDEYIEIWTSENTTDFLEDEAEIEYGIYFCSENFEKALKKWL